MTILRFIVSFAVLLLAAHIAVMNWGCVITSFRNKKRGIDQHHSTAPILSALLTLVAMMLCPRHDLVAWMLLVPLLDIGNWILLLSLPLLIFELIKKKPIKPADKSDASAR